MAFTHIQGASSIGTSVTSLTFTLSQAATAGNLIVVTFDILAIGTTGLSVTDNASTPNTYASAVGELDWNVSSKSAYQYYGVQVTGGATQVTVSWTTAHSARGVTEEFSGGASSNAAVFDKASTGVGDGSGQTSSAVTSFTPTSNGELIVAGIVTSTGTGSPGAGTNYTLGVNDGAIRSFSEYRLSSSGSETAPASWTNIVDWAEIASAFIAATPAASPVSFTKAPTVMVLR